MPAQFKDLALNSILVTLVVIAGLSAAQMASRTLLNRHPDEVYHVDAFCYFQDHWRPPDLNSDEVIYSPYGWSRVYTGEAVYVVFGQLSKAGNLVGQRNASPQASAQEVAERSCRNLDFRQFRFMNVALYVLTLATVFAMGRRDFWTIALGVGLVAIPQVVYVYSYANSDAWGLSLSIFLLLYALRLARKDNVSAWRAAGLGLLTGLVLLTKKPYWLTIPFAYLFLGAGVYAKFRAGDANVRHRSAVLLFLALFTATIVAGPLLVVYPWTQGDFAADELAMREKRAMDGFKPSDPTYEGLQLATRGEPFRAVVDGQGMVVVVCNEQLWHVRLHGGLPARLDVRGRRRNLTSGAGLHVRHADAEMARDSDDYVRHSGVGGRDDCRECVCVTLQLVGNRLPTPGSILVAVAAAACISVGRSLRSGTGLDAQIPMDIAGSSVGRGVVCTLVRHTPVPNAADMRQRSLRGQSILFNLPTITTRGNAT